MEVKESAVIIAELDRRRRENSLSYFKPYPFQSKFLCARDIFGDIARQTLLRAANQVGKCLIYNAFLDTPQGRRTVGSLFEEGKPFDVYSWDGEKKVVAKASAPFSKGEHVCFEIIFSDGSRIGAADRHRVLLQNGNYCFVEDLYGAYKHQREIGLQGCCGELSVGYSRQTPPDLTGHCLSDSYQCDGQLRQGLSNALGLTLPQPDARHSSLLHQIADVLACVSERSPYAQFDHLSNPDEIHRKSPLSSGLSAASLCRAFCMHVQPLFYSGPLFAPPSIAGVIQPLPDYAFLRHRTSEQGFSLTEGHCESRSNSRLIGLFQDVLQSAFGIDRQQSMLLLSRTYSSPLLSGGNQIVAVEPIGRKEVFDFEVEEHHNYFAEGMVHHNTFVGAKAVAYHATGLYPDGWSGKKFTTNTLCWVGGNTIPNTRDLCQAELLGEPGDEEVFGLGAIPKHLIGRVTKYHGIPDAMQSVMVKHVSGKWSKIIFKAYEQGKDAWMGKGVHYIWGDEEMPYEIYSQCLRATLKHKGLLGMTATPEKGMTPLMRKFDKELKAGQAMVTATWDDAPHLDEETKRQTLDGLLPYEREMRSKGIPVMGSGLVFPIAEDDIICEPFPIPDEWKHIAGIDFGGVGEDSHPTAMTMLATDPATDITYIYDNYRERGRTIPEHWLSMRRVGNTPVAWPHDGLVSDKGSGVSYKQQYADEGANMLPEKFSNPPSPDQQEGKGGNGVKAGLLIMYAAFKEGKLKVFSNQTLWFEEFRQYYLKDGEIVKEGDDLMSSTRYGYCSKRHALPKRGAYTSYTPKEDDYSDSLVGY